ncbi:class A beta-lactamase-related serine hydrolase [Neisseriaceae bacterium JH1-16]|nr:class A beta-lactamase-related serine hydrolase [Neisseriaceae bacterium JH1-16]
MTLPLTQATLADALRRAVLDQHFELIADPHDGGRPLRHFPSLDLALITFPQGSAPVYANVLFSRDHPEGVVAHFDSAKLAVDNVRFLADQQDAAGNSVAWRPDSDWSRLSWQALSRPSRPEHDFVFPYPASLLKLLPALGVLELVSVGRLSLASPVDYDGETRPLLDWLDAMITVSCNRSTSALTQLLHQNGQIVRNDKGESHNAVNALCERLGLPLLRFDDTAADGGWGNAAGAGVGHIHVGAWDMARLLWLLDDEAPMPTWQVDDRPVQRPLRLAERTVLRRLLHEQGLHDMLSGTALAGVPGYPRGLPAWLSPRWLTADDGARVDGRVYPPGAATAARNAEVYFHHKTGSTENYGSDAGIVCGIPGRATRHYIVSLTSNLGERYADPALSPGCYPMQLATLGAAIDNLMKHWLEP